MTWRGVILAGGKGTRMGELTRVTNKHLLPVGPWPMIYYPLKKLVGAGIADIMVVTGPEHMGDFVNLLGSGREHGCRLTYRVQDEAGGIAQALGLAKDFCGDRACAVVLGDNIFEEPINPDWFSTVRYGGRAQVLLKRVPDPSRYGVVEFDVVKRSIVGIEEKPSQPRSDFAVTGVYLYPPDVFDIIRGLKPSRRGELEITDVNRAYVHLGVLWYHVMEGYWTDAGTLESLAEANRLVAQSPPRFQ